MDRRKQLRVDNVLLQRGSDCRRGSLDITQHHLVFKAQGAEQQRIPYALLALVTRQASLLVSPSASISSNAVPSAAGPSRPARIYPLQLRFRTFDAASLGFDSEARASEVFEALKVRVSVATLDDLYAFHYRPEKGPQGGWQIYDFKQEYARQGLGKRTKAWRFTDVNAQYQFCPTYPSNLAIPTRISDATLQYAAKYRSKARIPALSYLHWANNGSITRCAQPLPGLKQARSVQDEKVVEAIFTSHLYVDAATSGTAGGSGVNGSAQINGAGGPVVYGATTTNIIIDARPTTNAVATYARGGGTENMDHYRGCKKAYMGIENIHVMRDSINRVVEALRAADEPVTFGLDVGQVHVDATASIDNDGLSVSQDMSRSTSASSSTQPRRPHAQPLDTSLLKRSNWLRHISTLLDASTLITRNVHIASSHCLIHCSDGWDRTSQLSALAQVCLDPYYRTMKGFAVLVEKDWLAFGHRFGDRCGHGGSDKNFVVNTRGDANGAGMGGAYDEEEGEEGLGAASEPAGTGAGGGAQAAANAFWGFTKQLTSGMGGGSAPSPSHGANGTSPYTLHHNIKETSPVFTQFLDCVWQIYRQFPNRFEFTDSWLVELHREMYECRFGTFLANCEVERRVKGLGQEKSLVETTTSVWDHLLSEESRERFKNQAYDPALDDPKGNSASSSQSVPDMGVLLPQSSPAYIRWWPGLFGARVEEANAALHFEESERQRRKAEKARWEQERLAKKEAELQLAREREEADRRVREMGLEDEAGLSSLGERGAGGSSTVESGVAGGTVDLVTASGLQRQQQQQGSTDGLPLSYQARTPKPRPPSSAQQDPQYQQAPGDAAAAAALRFKSWAMGGWDRFQGAMAGALPASPPVTAHDDDGTAAWGAPALASAPRQQQQHQPQQRHQQHYGSEAANPWADDAGKALPTAPPQQQQRHLARQTYSQPAPSKPPASSPSAANPWRDSSTSKSRPPPGSSLANSLEGLPTPGREDARGGRDAKGTTEGQGDVKPASAQASDPLGVGPL